MGFYIPRDGLLHSHRRENLKLYNLILSTQVRHGVSGDLPTKFVIYYTELVSAVVSRLKLIV
jgi:hypothetical protein